MGYDAFISYSHAGDTELSRSLQAGLQQLAKPWWRRRALRVFRDESALSVNPHLWGSIAEHLDESGWFVVLCSPRSAQSSWVGREIRHWVTAHDPLRVLPVLTEGTWEWDPSTSDFTAGSTAVPSALRGVFTEEPRHLDLRWSREATEPLDLRDQRFRSAVAELAAPIRGQPKDDLESEEVRQHRRTVRTAWAAAVALVALAAVSVVAATAAVRSADQARDNEAVARDGEARAQSTRLAAQAAGELADGQGDRALLLAVESLRRAGSDLVPARNALLATLGSLHGVVRFVPDPAVEPGTWSPALPVAALSPDGTWLAVGDAGQWSPPTPGGEGIDALRFVDLRAEVPAWVGADLERRAVREVRWLGPDAVAVRSAGTGTFDGGAVSVTREDLAESVEVVGVDGGRRWVSASDAPRLVATTSEGVAVVADGPEVVAVATDGTELLRVAGTVAAPWPAGPEDPLQVPWSDATVVPPPVVGAGGGGLALRGADGAAVVVDPDGLGAVTLPGPVDPALAPPVWDPTGRSVVAPAAPDAVGVFSPEGAELRRVVLDGPVPAGSRLVAGPAADRVAVVGPDGSVQVADTAGGAVVASAAAGGAPARVGTSPSGDWLVVGTGAPGALADVELRTTTLVRWSDGLVVGPADGVPLAFSGVPGEGESEVTLGQGGFPSSLTSVALGPGPGPAAEVGSSLVTAGARCSGSGPARPPVARPRRGGSSGRPRPRPRPGPRCSPPAGSRLSTPAGPPWWPSAPTAGCR